MRALRDVQILLCNEICAVFQLRGGQVAKPLRWTNERGVVSIAGIVRCGVSGVTASKHHDFSYRAYRTVVLPLLTSLLLTSNQISLRLSNAHSGTLYTEASGRTHMRSVLRVRTLFRPVRARTSAHYRYSHVHTFLYTGGIYTTPAKKKFFFNVHSFMHNEVEHHTFIRMATTML